jgi:hypothetical protein
MTATASRYLLKQIKYITSHDRVVKIFLLVLRSFPGIMHSFWSELEVKRHMRPHIATLYGNVRGNCKNQLDVD